MTEVLYLLGFSFAAQSAALDFVLEGAVALVPANLPSLRRSRQLMKKYADIPMDFADATLVAAAEDLSIRHVVTFDIRDFGIYRASSREPFVIVL